MNDISDMLARVRVARNFPDNTCPASRHVQMIGEALAKGKPYPMLTEEPEHCAGSLLAVVAALYEARTKLAATVQNETPLDPGMRVSAGENAPVVDALKGWQAAIRNGLGGDRAGDC